MFDHKFRVVTENLARTIGRRKFLAQAGSSMFVGMAALAAGHAGGGTAKAAQLLGSGTPGLSGDPKMSPTTPSCSPPGPYCNTGGGILTGCNGGHCFEHIISGQMTYCRVYYQFYPGGCWTTSSGGGYWTCCDCQCFSNPQFTGSPLGSCGCAQFSGSPSPMPGAPGR